jgi:hypothetical protein
VEKRKLNKPIPPVPQSIDDWPKVTIHEPGKLAVEMKKDGKKIAMTIINRAMALTGTGPWTRQQLDAAGMKVVYLHGKAVLKLK